MDPLSLAGSLITSIFSWMGENTKDKSAVEQLRLQIDMAALQSAVAADLSQAGINQAEAANPKKSLLTEWRDIAAWICVTGLAWQCVVQPIAATVAAIIGVSLTLPAVDTNTLITLLTGMLGLGGMHMYQSISIPKDND